MERMAPELFSLRMAYEEFFQTQNLHIWKC